MSGKTKAITTEKQREKAKAVFEKEKLKALDQLESAHQGFVLLLPEYNKKGEIKGISQHAVGSFRLEDSVLMCKALTDLAEQMTLNTMQEVTRLMAKEAKK